MGDVRSPVAPSSDPIFIRWVTWWPVSYWTGRFDHLASRDGVEFEAVFLSERSALLKVGVDRESLRFKHVVLSRRTDTAGYYTDFKVRLPRPWPLVRGQIDGLVVPYSEASCIAAAILCWLLRKPHFLFAPNTRNDERKPSRLREWLKGRLFENATGVLVTGPLQRDYALQYVEDEAKISTIGNPVGPLGADRYRSREAREQVRRRFGWGDEMVLLYVGRLVREKGLLTLLDSLARVAPETRPALVLVGSGPLEGRLRARATGLGLQVRFTGFLQREELALRYAAADMFVLPSRSEPWGLVVNEAMEFGLPLILSRNVGCAPVLLEEGRNGLAFAAGDPEALATCIDRLSADEGLRRRMGDASREIIRGHSVERWADAVLSAVRESRRSRRRGT